MQPYRAKRILKQADGPHDSTGNKYRNRRGGHPNTTKQCTFFPWTEHYWLTKAIAFPTPQNRKHRAKARAKKNAIAAPRRGRRLFFGRRSLLRPCPAETGLCTNIDACGGKRVLVLILDIVECRSCTTDLHTEREGTRRHGSRIHVLTMCLRGTDGEGSQQYYGSPGVI